MKHLLSVLLAILSVISYAQIDCTVPDQGADDGAKTTCGGVMIENLNFVSSLPRIEIAVRFHFEAKANGTNFSDALPGTEPWTTSNGYNFASCIMNTLNSATSRWIDGEYSNPFVTEPIDLQDSNIRFVWAGGSNSNSVEFYTYGENYNTSQDVLDIIFRGDENQNNNGGFSTTGFTHDYYVDEVYLRNAQRNIIEEDTDDYPCTNWGRITLHEIGHSMGLRHSFNSTNPCNGVDYGCSEEVCGQTCHNNDFNNGPNPFGCSTLTMGYGPQYRATKCELSSLVEDVIVRNTSYQSITCQPELAKEFIIDDGAVHTWDETVIMDADVKISNNSTLIVTCELFMGDDRSIYIEEGSKLIVDSGTIKTLCNSWKGIKARKNTGDYAVEIINKSTIENTSEPAVSMFASGGWLLGNGNAKVKIENSTFNNCLRMLAMGARTNSLNESIIANNIQNGGKHGITNWNCRGVQVTDNTFNNITNECIVTEHGQFTIERNTFHSGRADILFANTNPGFGTWMSSNTFNGSNTGIRALGASLGQHRIRENQFFTGEFDAFMDGDNNYLIEDNDFTSDFAITSINNGLHSNDVRRNNITGNFIGLLPTGDNSNYLFYDNCFNTSFTDSWIEGQINDPQAHGQNLGAANNCFTHEGNANHPTFDMTGNPSQFIYIEPNDNNLDCRDAEKAHASITIDKVDVFDASPCGSVGSGIGSTPTSTQFNPCNPPKDITITWDAISWLQDKLQQIETDPNLTEEQKDFYSDIYERCLQRVKWQWVQLVIEDERYDDARAYLASDGSNDAVLATYATYVSENNLNGARQYLNSINSNDIDLLDFIAIQMINLDRLENGRVSIPTSNQLQFVETIANKKHPYAGYAKALYYWMTGEIIVSPIPDFNDHDINPRNVMSEEVKANIYPNPFQNQLNIEIESGQRLRLEITDLFGQVYASKNISESTIINSDTWNNGLYIVFLYADGELIRQEKVALLK